MIDTVLHVVAVGIAACMAGLVIRVFKGPTSFDRLLAFNGMNTQAILLLLILGAIEHSIEFYIDIALGYAILSLVATLAATKFLKNLDHIGE